MDSTAMAGGGEAICESGDLRSAVLALARGGRYQARDGADPALTEALTAIAQGLQATTGKGLDAAAFGAEPPAMEDGLFDLLVLVRVDRFEALASRVGGAIARKILSALKDELLVSVPDARIGRLGHGLVEFTFRVADAASAERRLLRLRQALERPVSVDGEAFALPITIGAASPAQGASIAQRVGHAEQALARAELTESKTAIFCEKQQDDLSERLALIRDLRAGLSSNQLSLAYQPKLHLRSDSIDSVEALVRWTHPVRGVVSPDRFIELAEDTGDIGRITEQVLAVAIDDQAAIVNAGHALTTYVNLSGRLLTDEGFCRWMLDACARSAGRIGVEITETAVIADPDRALRNLHAIAEAGISIAIDDYGSGLSSLAYLKALPAHELKIDKSFILGLSSSHRDPLIVRSTIDLAHALQMEVTAEGVEEAAALALLQVMGCDRAQGYLISRPVDLAGLLAFLSEHAEGVRDGLGVSHPLLSLSRAKKARAS